MKTLVRVQAQWFGFVDVDPSAITGFNDRWAGGIFGCRTELTDGRWFVTTHNEAVLLRGMVRPHDSR